MLRISVSEPVDHSATVRLEGQLVGPWVTELRDACEKLLKQGRALKLDATEVSFIDGEGLALLGMLCRRKASLRGCSPFVREQLKAAGLPCIGTR